MAIRKVISRSIEDNTVAATDFQGAVTSLSNAGNLTFSSTGQRILGDMSNSTIANRVGFQTSTTNGNTDVQVLPNGTSVISGIRLNNNSDLTNAGYIRVSVNNNEGTLSVDRNSVSGTYLPLGLNTGGSERLRIDTSGNVGIGTGTIPTDTKVAISGVGLVLQDASGAIQRFNKTLGTDTAWISNRSYGWHNGNGLAISTQTADELKFGTNSAERMRITSAGSVGIGVSSPATKLDVYGGTSGPVLNLDSVNAYDAETGILFSAQRAKISGFLEPSGGTPGASLRFFTMPNDGSVTERMRITSTGALLINTTLAVDSTDNVHKIGQLSSTAYARLMMQERGGNWISFCDGGAGHYGTIARSGSGVSYGSNSDYRLKENIKPMIGGLDRVVALKPVTYTWKESGLASEGFIAHELQEIIPDAVVGEKDGINPETNTPAYQTVDTSFVVATLTAAIQEQQVLITELKARLDAAGL